MSWACWFCGRVCPGLKPVKQECGACAERLARDGEPAIADLGVQNGKQEEARKDGE